jgi:hypothetical protein
MDDVPVVDEGYALRDLETPTRFRYELRSMTAV